MTRHSGYEKTGGHASPEEPVTQLPQVPGGPAQGAPAPAPQRYGECNTCYQRVELTTRNRCFVHKADGQRCPGSARLPIYTRAPATHIPGTTTAHLPAGETQ